MVGARPAVVAQGSSIRSPPIMLPPPSVNPPEELLNRLLPATIVLVSVIRPKILDTPSPGCR